MTPLARVEAAILRLETMQADSATIDAQLAILRDAAARMRVEQNQDGIPLYYRHSLALADAINAGGTQ